MPLLMEVALFSAFFWTYAPPSALGFYNESIEGLPATSISQMVLSKATHSALKVYIYYLENSQPLCC